ncbi:MAG: hypothetical protein ACR2PX_25810 [Endozoicomonas sp.]|uniref:hypothetical protein n=1 Tax=Endozoicomonas sp. TaxID=1892382 RepID=UPI003D9B5401
MISQPVKAPKSINTTLVAEVMFGNIFAKSVGGKGVSSDFNIQLYRGQSEVAHNRAFSFAERAITAQSFVYFRADERKVS